MSIQTRPQGMRMGRPRANGKAAGWTQVYYFNTLTNESSWTKPEGFKGEEDGAKQAKPVSSIRVRGTRWSRVECEDGKTYYYHVDTKVCRLQDLWG